VCEWPPWLWLALGVFAAPESDEPDELDEPVLGVLAGVDELLSELVDEPELLELDVDELEEPDPRESVL
jgi:hypothetical protein